MVVEVVEVVVLSGGWPAGRGWWARLNRLAEAQVADSGMQRSAGLEVQCATDSTHCPRHDHALTQQPATLRRGTTANWAL